MSIFKKKLKIGRRVAVIAFSFDKNRDEFKVGKIVAMREKESDNAYDYRTYAVRFDDGEIGLFKAQKLFTEWGEEEE